jgi:hypothetical protein
VLPGKYTVRLTVDGHTLTQPLEVRMDPRVKTARADLEVQHTLSMRLLEALSRTNDAIKRVGAGGGAAARPDPDIARLNQQLAQLLAIVQGADARPTSQVEAAVGETLRAVEQKTR